MWRRAPFLSCWARLGLVALLVGGCAAKADPFGQQVRRIDEISIAGEELFSRGELKRASRNFSRALTMSRSVDYLPGEAQQLNNLGAVALEEGDYPKARDYFTQAYNLNQERQQFVAASINQANLATVAAKQGQPAAVSQHLSRLRAGGLVQARRDGMTTFYRCCGSSGTPPAVPVLTGEEG